MPVTAHYREEIAHTWYSTIIHYMDRYLNRCRQQSFLGLNLHEQLSWNFHTDVTSKKANRAKAFIVRNIRSCPKKVKAACYTTLVRPMTEYATTAWALSHTVQHYHKLQQVQRRAHCSSVCMPQVRQNSQCNSNDEWFEVGVTGD